MERVALFMLPYAGASASVYEKWKLVLQPSIDVVPVELPGRGRRFPERLLTSIPALVEDAYGIVAGRLSSGPYALFGHSLGSLIAFELARKAVRCGHRPPEHLFVSGRAAPSVKASEEMTYLLPDDLFRQKILRFGGTPPEIFRNEDYLSVFMPILKADYEAYDTYRFKEEAERLSCPVTVFHGLQDEPGDPELWGLHTTGDCNARAYQGGHFFIHEHAKPIAEWMKDVLAKREECSR